MMKRMKWRKWILGAALVVACAESVVLWQRSQGDKYLRYVSEPLADGTRYTFLYPARMRTQRQVAAGGSPASVASPVGIVSAVSSQGHASPSGCTDLSVQVNTWRFRTKGAGREDKKNFYSHSIHVGQDGSRNQFYLQHRNCDQEEQPFEREDSVVIPSFQILPPGAPVPSP